MSSHEVEPQDDRQKLLAKIHETNALTGNNHQIDPAEMLAAYDRLCDRYGDRRVINPHNGAGVSSFPQALLECGPPLIAHLSDKSEEDIEELLNALSPDFGKH
jgi:hypothetical protein